MEITIGAKCWDGVRSKSLSDIVKVEGLPQINGQRFMDKIERVSRRLNDPKVKAIVGFAVPLAFLAGGLPPFGLTNAFAQGIAPASDVAVTAMAMPAGLKETILHAFDPLIDLIQALAYPIAGVMIAGGCLFIMCGNREKGMSMLQNAAIGYILVQLSPMLLKLLVGVGSSIA